MGYYTDFYLQAAPVTEDQFHSIDSALQELRSMREAYFDDGTGYWENTEDTWYQSFDNMVEVSRHFPEVTFTLTKFNAAPSIRCKHHSDHTAGAMLKRTSMDTIGKH